MAELIGIVLALAVALFAHGVGFDRSNAFYPVVLIVIASYYVLFAVIGGSPSDLLIEGLIFSVFVFVAVIGFRTSLWIVVGGLALHGIFDLFGRSLMDGRGVPSWWPPFCLAYDLAAATGLAVVLLLNARGVDDGRTGRT